MSNHIPPSRRNFGLVFLLLLIGAIVLTFRNCQGPAVQDTASPSSYAQTIYLVRHAEKQKGDNPALTEAGQVRAEVLAEKLDKKGIDHIFTSQYQRTMDTAKPLANRLDKDMILYNPSDLAALADRIKSEPGTYLVVGHSNTTPELASLLAGETIKSMPETEYDRFLTVKIKTDGKAEWKAERFGAVNHEPEK